MRWRLACQALALLAGMVAARLVLGLLMFWSWQVWGPSDRPLEYGPACVLACWEWLLIPVAYWQRVRRC